MIAKEIIKGIFAPLFTAFALILMLTGCSDPDDILDPVDPVDPIIVTPPEPPSELSVVVSGSVVDSASGAVVDGATVSFYESGEVATNILDIDGNAVTSLVVTDGSFEVTTANDITSFKMVASADAYSSDSLDVSFGVDDKTITVQLELLSDETEGVAAVAVEAAVVDATVAEEITVTTEELEPGEDAPDGSVDVVIPAAVQLQDADGNAVAGDTLTVDVTYVESTEADDAQPEDEGTSIADVIPEGLNSDAAADEVLVPVGVAEVNMDIDGTAVKEFSSPITITINLPSDTQVPSAGRVVAEGDQFGVRSYDEQTLTWKTEENNAIVGAAVGDTFPAALEIDHLTFFALTDAVAACESDINFSFSGDDVPASGLKLVVRSNEYSNTDFFSEADTTDVAFNTVTAAEAKSLGITADTNASVKVKDFDGNVWYTSAGDISLCGASIDIVLDNPVVTVNENLSLTLSCSNDETVSSPLQNAVVSYRKNASSPSIVAVEGEAGVYSLVSLDSSLGSYLVKVNTRGESGIVNTSITPDGANETFDIANECDVATGSGAG